MDMGNSPDKKDAQIDDVKDENDESPDNGRVEDDGDDTDMNICTPCENEEKKQTTSSRNPEDDGENENSNDDNNEDINSNRSENDNDNSNNDEESISMSTSTSASASNAPPPPKFQIKQRVLARDTDTPLLYEAVVRKIIFAPKSKQVRVCNLNLSSNTNSNGNSNGQSDNNHSDENNVHNGDTIPDNFEAEDNLDALLSSTVTNTPIKTWHYFVHYQGWNVKWDRWVEEEKLFDDTEQSRILAKRLKQESQCLKKRKPRPSDKLVLEIMQRMVRLERDFREKEARGEVHLFDVEENEDEKNTNQNVNANVDVSKKKKKNTPKSTTAPSTTIMTNKQTTARFIQNEVKLRRSDLCSKKPPNDLDIPFPMKKILVHEWEVISQCGMLHCLPATVSVMDALNAYYEGKIRMLRNCVPSSNENTDENTAHGPIEEKKDDNPPSSSSSSCTSTQRETTSAKSTNDTANDTHGGDDGNVRGVGSSATQPENPEEQQWKDMSSGLAMFFDHVLPNKLLYRHELPQCIVLQEKYDNGDESNKRFCEMYSCEYLLRLCLKLPELVADSKDIGDKEKSEINYKLGDFLRFLQKHQDTYILQRYRKPDADEAEKAKKLQSRLGLIQEAQKNSTDSNSKKDVVVRGHGEDRNQERNENDVCYSDAEDVKRKRKGSVGPMNRKKKKINSNA